MKKMKKNMSKTRKSTRYEHYIKKTGPHKKPKTDYLSENGNGRMYKCNLEEKTRIQNIRFTRELNKKNPPCVCMCVENKADVHSNLNL